MLLVDTNVLLDVVTNDPIWADWSQRQLEKLSLQGALLVNPVIYAELSIGFQRIEEVEAILKTTGVDIAEIPRRALFLAGKAFAKYRARSGDKDRRAAPFLHRRPCRGRRPWPFDPRYPPLPDLFSNHRPDHAE